MIHRNIGTKKILKLNLMMANLNEDCLIYIFNNLSMNEKLKCRLICKKWKQTIDGMFAGQRYLELFSVNSSIVNSLIRASGLYPRSSTLSKYSSCDCLMKNLKNIWSNINANFPVNLQQIIQQHSSTDNGLDNFFDDDPNELISNNINQTTESVFNQLNIKYSTYAFSSSSSLFASYSFEKSTLNSHKYHHSYCDCHIVDRHKYSVILNQENISFKQFNIILKRFSNTNTLSINGIDQLSDILFFMITKHCTKIKCINITDCAALNRIGNNQHSPFNCLTGESTNNI